MTSQGLWGVNLALIGQQLRCSKARLAADILRKNGRVSIKELFAKVSRVWHLRSMSQQ